MKYQINKYLANLPGWRTKRKIVVFESDDWGSIRMSSKKDRELLSKKGFDFTNQPFNQFDALESNADLENILGTLSKHRDSNGKLPVFTFVNIIGNPNFTKIKESNYREYFWEPFTETLKRYPSHDKVYQLYKDGVNNQLIYPVLHGREHLHVQRWLRKLQTGNKSLLLAFEHGVTGVHKGVNNEFIGNYQAAFDLDFLSELPFMENAIKDASSVFLKLWGYKSRYFVPPNGPFNNSLECVLKKYGVDYLLTERLQREPWGEGKYKTHIHYLGMKNKSGQCYITRNAFFEPVSDKNSVHTCLKDIERAFRWCKPAVISSHRVNYIGFIEDSNRTKNLKALDELLQQILKHWPDVEFMTSVELGDFINQKRT